VLAARPIPNIRGISDSLPSSDDKPNLDVLPPFTAQDREKFQSLFLERGPTNGLLDGRLFAVRFQSKSSTLL
jgi:hypothetical protein